MNDYNERLDYVLFNLVNQVAANEQRLLNGNATRKETINSNSKATMKAKKVITSINNAEIAKVLRRLESERDNDNLPLSDILAEQEKYKQKLLKTYSAKIEH